MSSCKRGKDGLAGKCVGDNFFLLQKIIYEKMAYKNANATFSYAIVEIGAS